MKTNLVTALAAPILGLALAGFAAQSHAATYFQGFNGPGLPSDWTSTNLSTDAGNGSGWTIGQMTSASGSVVQPAQEGNAYAIANYTSVGSVAGSGTISNWLISPEFFGMTNGDTFSFYTATAPGSAFADGLQFRLSSAGAGVDVGSSETTVGTFTTQLMAINAGLAAGGYPTNFTKYTVSLSGLSAPINGRVAFRYFVTDGGEFGNNSNIVGVDSFSYVTTAAVPEPGTWALMGAGFGALVFLQRKRKVDAS